MSKFIIVGDCNGVNYYLNFRGEFGRYVDFSWQGLQDNGTSFNSLVAAKEVVQKISPKTKLNTRIEPIK
jgi:hypothetical protein